MGQTYVGLYDENEHCVMLIYWGDSWVGSQKGYFNIGFYPQNGGAYYQQSGYIYTSFCKTGKVWWTSYPGGQGGIMTSIDGAGDAYPIGECDNASRVIKYVAMWGGRYSSYSLVQMKIHDINVVCDPNVHDPNAPSIPPPTQDPPSGGSQVHTECDGTQLPKSHTAETTLSSFEGSASNFLSCYWTGWWPTLHFVINFSPYPSATISVGIWVDILGMWGIDSFSFQLVNEASMSDSQINALAAGGSQAFRPYWFDFRALTIALNVAYWVARTLASFAERGNLLCQGLFAAAVIAFLILWHMWIIEFLHMVVESAMDSTAAAYTLVAMAVSVLLVVGSVYAQAGRLPSAVYSAFGIKDVVWEEWSLAS
jgi:hypothetical protein